MVNVQPLTVKLLNVALETLAYIIPELALTKSAVLYAPIPIGLAV